MDPLIGAALVSGGSNLLGGLLGSSAASQQAEQNRQMQLMFAQNAIQWKVADAKKAGVHPLFALGASTGSFTPVANNSGEILGDAVGKMGQNIGRAMEAGADKEGKALLMTKARLEVENQGLQNDILRNKIASDIRVQSQAAGSPPAMPPAGFTFDVTDPRGVGKAPKGSAGGWPLKVEEDTRQALSTFGRPWKIMNTPDAQAIENRYGDLLEEVGGVANLVGDTGANIYDVLTHGPGTHEEAVNKFRRYIEFLYRQFH